LAGLSGEVKLENVSAMDHSTLKFTMIISILNTFENHIANVLTIPNHLTLDVEPKPHHFQAVWSPATGATSRYLLSWSRSSRASATRRCHLDGAGVAAATAATAATGLGEADIGPPAGQGQGQAWPSGEC